MYYISVLAVYYPVPVSNSAEMLNGTGYRSRIFYLLKWHKTLGGPISVKALDREYHKICLAPNHL